MISPTDIKKKVLRIWNSGKFLSAWCSGEDIFPIDIPFGKIGGANISNNYNKISKAIEELKSSSKGKTGKGYSIDFTTISHRQLGRQNIPERIYIETKEDFLTLCSKKKEYKLFTHLYLETEKIFPLLCPFIKNNPLNLINNGSQWEKLLKVCKYFYENPKQSIYIRQIVIPGIETKFIETNKKIISEMLIFLEPAKYGNQLRDIGHHKFEKRFGFLYDEPLIRFRILDKNLYIQKLNDITLPLSQFSTLNINVKKIFITENKINGLTFPMSKEAIIIFGLGYGIQILKNIEWIKNREIYYWGDIDTHGFSILSMTREIVSQCRSFLMDEKTLISHRESWSKEDDNKRFTGKLPNLTENEKTIFESLKSNKWGVNIRLEQELIGFNFLTDTLNKFP